MFQHSRSLAICVLALGTLLQASSTPAQAQAAPGNVPVTAVVTAIRHNFTDAPPVAKEDVNVHSGKEPLNIREWIRAAGDHDALELAILIDDAIQPQVIGVQLNDIRDFIKAQPKDTAVGVFYADFGTVFEVSPFSTNHAQVASKVRLTQGRRYGGSPSIYLSLSDLAKKWPPANARREVLVIASGVDVMEPGPVDPYFDASLEDLQRAGIVVHSMYVGGYNLGTRYEGLIAQGNLVQITKDTGGMGFFQGIQTPVAFAPFLKQLSVILRNQYILIAGGSPGRHPKGDLRGIKLHIEQHGLKIMYPRQVLFPGK